MARSFLLALNRYTPAALSFFLLAWQLSLPWRPAHFVTQDGPSHLYGGVVLRELLLHHAHSIYSPWYTIQRTPLPNWAASILLGLADGISGAGNAERLFANFAVLAGFLSIAYAIRALSPTMPPFHPLSNFLLQTWFLGIGFYNFLLGMALMPFAIGFYARCRERFPWSRATGLAAIFFAIYASHLVAAFVAVMAVILMALWSARERRASHLFKVAIAALPVLILALIYALGQHGETKFVSDARLAWEEFPMQVFITASGPDGFQGLPRKILLLYAALAALLLRKEEWRSPGGALVLTAAAAFLLYLFVPDNGLGGGYVKIRFSYALFLLAGIAAVNTYRLRWAQAAVALCFAFFVARNLPASGLALDFIAGAANEYLSVASHIPSRVTFARLRYETPAAPDRFLYKDAGRDPLEHLDAFIATCHGAVDLTDYEAISLNFPLVFKKAVDPGQQSGLGAFGEPDPGSLPTLKWLNNGLPKPIDYVLVIGDRGAPGAVRQGILPMLDYLDGAWQQVAISREGWFSLYRRPDAPCPADGGAPCR